MYGTNERYYYNILLQAVLTELIAHCDSKNLSGKGAVSSWHPFFGWTSDKVDRKYVSISRLH